MMAEERSDKYADGEERRAADEKSQNLFGLEFAQEQAIDLREADDAQCVDAENPAVVFRTHSEESDQDERRSGDVGEHPGIDGAPREGVAEKMAVAKEFSVGAE